MPLHVVKGGQGKENSRIPNQIRDIEENPGGSKLLLRLFIRHLVCSLNATYVPLFDHDQLRAVDPTIFSNSEDCRGVVWVKIY